MSDPFEQFRLSNREREIVNMLMSGTSVAKIAAKLELSPHTVRNHLKSCFRKTGVSSQVELVTRFSANLPARLPEGPVDRLRDIVDRIDRTTELLHGKVCAMEAKIDRIVELLDEAANLRRTQVNIEATHVDLDDVG